jgi:transposase
MTTAAREVYGGVDTHGKTHHAAAIDEVGRVLDDREFPANKLGYRQLIVWLAALGRVVKVGVEGTGSYGAGLAALLRERGVQVVEVDRPDRRARRRKGKSDPLDAVASARAALSGEADGTPKSRSGPVEAIRVLRVARRGAVKARTAAMNQLHGLLISAPAELRESLTGLAESALLARCAGFRSDSNGVADPVVATKAALRALARRIRVLSDEIKAADRQLRSLTARPRRARPLCSASAWRSPASSSSAPGTIPSGCAANPRSPICAQPHRSPRARGAPTGIGSTVAAIARPMPRSIWLWACRPRPCRRRTIAAP